MVSFSTVKPLSHTLRQLSSRLGGAVVFMQQNVSGY